MTILILKMLCLFIALWFWPINIVKAVRGQGLPMSNMILASASAVGLVTLFYWLPA